MSDDVTNRDGDAGFLGVASRLNPLTLPAGMLQDSVNLRLDRGVAQVRRGAKRLADGISLPSAPLTVPFVLGTDKAVVSITRTSGTATATVTGHGYSTGDIVNIRGATQAEYNGDPTITVTGADTFTYSVTGTPATPATGTIIAHKGPVVRTSYTGGIFAAGVFSDPSYDGGDEWVILCGGGSAYLWRQGESVVTKSYPSTPDETIEQTDAVSTVQAFNRFYIFREADRSVSGWGEQLTNASGITVTTTTATVNVTGHGYTEGMRVRIEGSTTAAFNGHEFDIVTSGTNSFTITVPSGTATHAAAGIKVRRVKPPLYWDGGAGNFVRSPAGVPSGGATFKTLRGVPWASYMGNRLVIPDGRDSLAVSDILDPNTFDPFWQSVRLNQGSDDRLVAAVPWVDGGILVFMRKSIWLVKVQEQQDFSGTDPLITQVTLLTNEVGCVARETIARAGQFVFFLSDAGVYRLDTGLELSLRGDTEPLSAPIADQLEDLNATLAPHACGLWHGNRYWLAVPIGTGATGNNRVLIWNALNGQWETRDTYEFGVQAFLVSDYETERRVFVSSRTGKLFLLDERTDGDDPADAAVTNYVATIPGRLVTRRYGFGDLHDKRFLRILADVEADALGAVPSPAQVTVAARTINPDAEVTVGALSNTGAGSEDYTLKAPVRRKAHAMDVVITTNGGRPQVRSVAVEATGKAMASGETRSRS
jgi:hypothetical protein